MTEIACLRCGKCCFYTIKGVPSKVRCRYLVRLEGWTKCNIYNTRLGRNIGHGNKCVLRKESVWNFENCPLNSLHPEKSIFREEDRI